MTPSICPIQKEPTSFVRDKEGVCLEATKRWELGQLGPCLHDRHLNNHMHPTAQRSECIPFIHTRPEWGLCPRGRPPWPPSRWATHMCGQAAHPGPSALAPPFSTRHPPPCLISAKSHRFCLLESHKFVHLQTSVYAYISHK